MRSKVLRSAVMRGTVMRSVVPHSPEHGGEDRPPIQALSVWMLGAACLRYSRYSRTPVSESCDAPLMCRRDESDCAVVMT